MYFLLEHILKKTEHFTENWFTVDPVTKKYLIEIKVDNYRHLFNSLDPAPFTKRDLNLDVAQYIIEGARHIPKKRNFSIDFYLPESEKDAATEEKIKKSIYNFFNYKYNYAGGSLKQLLLNTLIGFAIAIPLLALASFFTILFGQLKSVWQVTVLNGTTVAGWVALWTPVSNLLFRLFEIIEEIKLYKKILDIEVRFRYS